MENVTEKRLRVKNPPFLEKLYQMVEDPNTDALISWSDNKQSFIVWDQFKFSDIIMPKYFKHQKFASFIGQLNHYGFKKVDYDRFEFANKWFRAGDWKLLCNIEKNIPQKKRASEAREITSEPKMLRLLEEEINYLKSENKLLKIEIQELRNNQELTAHEVANMKSKENEMINFIKECTKSQANMTITNDADRKELSEAALLNQSFNTRNSVIIEQTWVEDDDPIVCENKWDGELITQYQLKYIHELKDLIS